eukprot:Lithocolla_globosa_v1_NODE_8280_length_839_cov_26.331633.p1 type:complete len:141 gc:universal NODE_8280_length_839_cov_26.331633:227-649(+)
MNSPIVIENFHTETYSKYLFNVASWNENIYIDFIPDEIILKNITVYDDTTDHANNTKLFLVKSSLNNRKGTMASFPQIQAFHENYHTPYKNNNQINGSYEFKITDINGNAPSPDAVNFKIHIAITIVFAKYRKSTKDMSF